MSFTRIRLDFAHDGRVAHVVLAHSPGNVLDAVVMEELTAVCQSLTGRSGLRAIVVAADGDHFSYGASIQEHLPRQMAAQLARFRHLLLRWTRLPAPTIAAIHGRCLGGGLELALACDLIVAAEDAQLAFPEIKLASFPPAGTTLLPLRIGTGPAAELLLTGDAWDVATARAHGLVNRVAKAGELHTDVAAWVQSSFLPRSATALRMATRALRGRLRAALAEELPELERLYLRQLLPHADAEEGVRAFLEKRPPRWQE